MEFATSTIEQVQVNLYHGMILFLASASLFIFFLTRFRR